MRPGDLAADADLAGIGDHRGEAVLVRGDARRHVAAQAPRLVHDPVGIDDVDAERGVDHRRDHRFPVVAQRETLVDEQLPLARAVVQQHVVAALARRPRRCPGSSRPWSSPIRRRPGCTVAARPRGRGAHEPRRDLRSLVRHVDGFGRGRRRGAAPSRTSPSAGGTRRRDADRRACRRARGTRRPGTARRAGSSRTRSRGDPPSRPCHPRRSAPSRSRRTPRRRTRRRRPSPAWPSRRPRRGRRRRTGRCRASSR